MQKIRLNLDELDVATFDLDDDVRVANGTVYANTTVDSCHQTLCDTCDTCLLKRD
jgi:hypothetical protein